MNTLKEKILGRRLWMFGAVLALAAAGSAVVWAHGAGDAQAMDAAVAPADFADHVARMSEHIYSEAGVTDEQRARLDPIFSLASSDLKALHAKFGGGHDQVMQLLTQDTIDRAALENLRVEHMRAADEASKRIVQLIADVAEVLTPAQRKILVDRISEHHSGHMGWHHG